MIIGVDFDNTVVCYDKIFYRVAIKLGIIPVDIEPDKSNIRDYLRRKGREYDWTELQGLIYGKYIKDAPAFPGVKDFFKYCKKNKINVCIISQKTRYPFLGFAYDLHRAANNWLRINGFFEKKIGLSFRSVFFELTKEEKMKRIQITGCTHFIDDLPEFLKETGFPKEVKKILFDPHNVYLNKYSQFKMNSWVDIKKTFMNGGGAF